MPPWPFRTPVLDLEIAGAVMVPAVLLIAAAGPPENLRVSFVIGDAPDIVDAFPEGGHRIADLFLVLILHGQIAVIVLDRQFGQQVPDQALPRTPRHVVDAFGRAVIVPVLQVDVEDPPLEKFERFAGIVHSAHPVPVVGAGADPGILAVDAGEHGFGQVVLGRGGVIMDGDLDVVFLDQLLEESKVVVGGFADDDPDAHFPGELENLAHTFLSPADVDHAVPVEIDAGRAEDLLGLGDLLDGHVLIEPGAGEFGPQSLPGERFDGRDPEFLDLLDRLEKREFPERPGFRGDRELFDADIFIIRRFDRFLKIG
jgi:hypothetical protein